MNTNRRIFHFRAVVNNGLIFPCRGIDKRYKHDRTFNLNIRPDRHFCMGDISCKTPRVTFGYPSANTNTASTDNTLLDLHNSS